MSTARYVDLVQDTLEHHVQPYTCPVISQKAGLFWIKPLMERIVVYVDFFNIEFWRSIWHQSTGQSRAYQTV